MEFRQLSYFVHIVNEKSFTKASLKLHVSQSALSKMIKILEDEIGAKLLKRKGKEIMLTDIGKNLYQKSKPLVDQFEDVCDYVDNIANTEEGSITVGIPPVIGTCLFPQILPAFYEKFPRINLVVVEEGARTVYEKVSDEKIDIGIVIKPVDDEKFSIFPVIEDKMMLVVHKDHPLVGRSSVTMKDIRDENLVLLNKTFMLHHNIIAACNLAGFKPNITMESANWDFLLALASIRQGVTILPRPIVIKYRSPDIRAIPIEDELLNWSIMIIANKQKLIPSVARKFIKFTQENACFQE